MSEKSSGGGIGFIGGLQLLFIGLKLGKVIDWSWWLVFSPFLIVLLFITLIFGFAVLHVIMKHRG